MPGKRASKETSRTPRECAAGRPEGRKALWAGGEVSPATARGNDGA